MVLIDMTEWLIVGRLGNLCGGQQHGGGVRRPVSRA